jgi:lipopolysaccharide/colanic/teichoic acid biosynthesis glycosyltransferase
MQLKQVRVKYIIDRVGASVLLLLLSPLFILIALLIKLESRGPVFFLQQRPGLNVELFHIWKFRSMVENADQLLGQNGQATGDRITRLGKLLRALSLDELPQLINIVKGEMSFVGPRPALPGHLDRYTVEQKGRFAMKPGVTGLAQVNGRNTLKWSRRISYDLEYIKNYSLLLDVKILFKTVKVVLLREGIVLDRNPGQVDDL